MARFSACALLLIATCLAAGPPHARASSGGAPDGAQRNVHDALQVRCFATRVVSRAARLRFCVHCPAARFRARTR